VAVRVAGWAADTLLFAVLEGRPGVYWKRWRRESLHGLNMNFRKDAVIAILAGWLALAIVGRWIPERAWDDSLGRPAGLLWVIFYLGAELLALVD
jgi:hypothetical protein